MKKKVMAAGGVIWRQSADGIELVVIHRPKYDDWSIPKGKVDPGERLEDTALREVEEETALTCELGAWLGVQEYPQKKKEVHYWTMQVVSAEEFTANAEVDQLRWIRLEEAHSILTYSQDRELIQTFSAAWEKAQVSLTT